jgi:hypothetical protein
MRSETPDAKSGLPQEPFAFSEALEGGATRLPKVRRRTGVAHIFPKAATGKAKWRPATGRATIQP